MRKEEEEERGAERERRKGKGRSGEGAERERSGSGSGSIGCCQTGGVEGMEERDDVSRDGCRLPSTLQCSVRDGGGRCSRVGQIPPAAITELQGTGFQSLPPGGDTWGHNPSGARRLDVAARGCWIGAEHADKV